jgi:DNA-binding transcriptional MerR regulator
MEPLTPGEVAQQLKVSAPTVRRMGTAYEEVFGALPRDARGHRIWSLDAVRRVQAAHTAVGSGKVTSLEAALRMVQDGAELPARTVLPVESDVLSELLAEVRSLRALAEAQGRELAALRSALAESRALPAPVGTGDLAAEVATLREQLTAQGERQAERLRVLAHGIPAPAPAGGSLARLLRLLGLRA